MTSYLNYLMVEAQQADLAEGARRDPPRHLVRRVPHPPGQLRARTARMLMSLAMRLDDRPDLSAARVAPFGGHL